MKNWRNVKNEKAQKYMETYCRVRSRPKWLLLDEILFDLNESTIKLLLEMLVEKSLKR